MIDAARFREVLSLYPTGVAVVTAVGPDGRPSGMAIGSFTSVSLSPPLIGFFPDKTSTSFPAIRTADSFCVNVLAADQLDLCSSFARSGGDKFADVQWDVAPSGAPRLHAVAAWIDCSLESVSDAGDHYFVLGRVTALDGNALAAPLLFVQGGYGRPAP